MSTRIAGVMALWAVLVGPGRIVAAETTRPLVAVALKDGSRLVGEVVAEDEATLTLQTRSGLELRIAVAEVVGREPVTGDPGLEPKAGPSSLVRAELTDPNDSRLMFAPTGRPLRKGDGYFSDHYVVFPGFAYGLTDHLSVSGGVSLVPGLGLQEQVLYVSSSVGWRLSPKAAFSLGGLYAAGGEYTDSAAGALLFGVGSFGSSDRSLSLGVALAATRDEQSIVVDEYGNFLNSSRQWSFRDAPVLMVGGTFRVGKRLSLVTESWLFLGRDFKLSQQPLGIGLRFFGERLSVDVGFILVAEILDEGLPLPWLSFAYHFGPSRKAASERGVAGARSGFEPRARALSSRR